MSDRGEILVELFADLVDLDTHERAAALAEREVSDPSLVAELEALLEADRAADDNPILSPGWLAKLAPPPGSRIGDRVGDFELRRLIGSGGMGDVYAAERVAGDFDQRVAIKLVRADLASPALLERFAAERQILARLSHRNIAALFGGGVDSNRGERPYFVMELVDGVPLDLYVDEQSPDLDQRIELMMSICDAVAHAHSKLVVHCDLKPDNVLVTADGEVKLLDFGVATALHEQGERAAAMTPAYAAPELADGGSVSTAADVYSLGVILYELAGRRRPDRADPEPLGVSRDLDAICARALATDPADRYPTVAALAADLAASRSSRPVAARGGGWVEAVAKLLARHRLAAAIAGFALVAVTGLAVYYTVRVAAERDRARAEARRAAATSDLIAGLFSGVDPAEARGEPLSVGRLLARGRARIETDLADQPAERARLLAVLAEVFTSLGHYRDAESALESALAIERAPETLLLFGNARREQTDLEGAERAIDEALGLIAVRDGERSLAYARALLELAAVRVNAGDHARALKLASRALGMRRELGAPAALVARTLASVGEMHLGLRDFEAAERSLRDSLALARQTGGDVHPDTARALSGVAISLRKQKRYDDAEPLYLEALRINEKLYRADHPDIAHNLNHIGRLYSQRGEHERAEPYLRRGLEMRRRLYGDGHAAVSASLGALAQLYGQLGRYRKALELAAEAHRVTRRLYGESHPYVAGSLAVHARLVLQSGSTSKAVVLFREVARIARSLEVSDPGRVARAVRDLGEALCADGDRAAGLAALEEAGQLAEVDDSAARDRCR